MIMDQGYSNHERVVQLMGQIVYFVTRLKNNASFEVVETLPVPLGSRAGFDSSDSEWLRSRARAESEQGICGRKMFIS